MKDGAGPATSHRGCQNQTMADRPLHRSGTALATALSLAAALVLGGCGGGGSNPVAAVSPTPIPPLGPSSAMVELDGTNFDALVTDRSGVELVEFYHPTCPYCQEMVPVVEQLAQAYVGRALIGRVSVAAQPDLTRAWGVAAWPAFVYVRDGVEVNRSYGATTYDHLASMLEDALGG
jgi:thioredoxin 1